jgi:EAL domain-containing protein (putative c-di-GMP-specific phosphodiesterase class I)
VRERDTVARLGGDEFTIIVHDVTDSGDLRGIAEKAIGVLREPFMLGGRLQRVTGSAGITVFPDDGDKLQVLLRNADIAMYKSKQAGRNRLHFYAPQMQAEAQLRVRLEADLREAIAQRAFVLHYQPVVDADSGELVGAEALLRWQHPQRGLLKPAEFLMVAEDSGLIVPIGEWVLQEAARQWRRWQRPGEPPLRLAVNLAGVQVRSASLVAALAAMLEEAGAARTGLALEVGEAILGSSGGGARSQLAALKALGVSLTLDRFGSGFSSLAALKRHGVDTVKIDRRFLLDCPQDRDNAHLVEAIVNMSHSLGLRVAACGVESEAQRVFLRDLGCDDLQGHLIARPMPAARFEELVLRQPSRRRADGGSVEHDRLLAAIRQDDLDVEDWLRRLLNEHSSEVADYLEGRNWMSRGLDLRDAVEAHLQCRRSLGDLVLERGPGALREAFGDGAPGARAHDESTRTEGAHPTTQPRCSGPGRPCMLRTWTEQMRRRGDERFVGFERALAHYHRLADEIAADCRLGYRDSARRALASLKFRAASRDVLLALVEGFKDAGHTVAAPLDQLK